MQARAGLQKEAWGRGSLKMRPGGHREQDYRQRSPRPGQPRVEGNLKHNPEGREEPCGDFMGKVTSHLLVQEFSSY